MIPPHRSHCLPGVFIRLRGVRPRDVFTAGKRGLARRTLQGEQLKPIAAPSPQNPANQPAAQGAISIEKYNCFYILHLTFNLSTAEKEIIR